MNTSLSFLHAVKVKYGIQSDYALAKKLGVSKQVISNQTSGKVSMSDATAIKVAHALEIEPATVLAAAHAERAKSEDEKAAWKFIYEKLGGIAASVALATIMLTTLNPTEASAGVVSHSVKQPSDLYIIRNRKRRKHQTQNGILSLFRQFVPSI